MTVTDFLNIDSLIALVRNVGSFIVVLGILVFFHEMGHFLVAKLSGVRVHEFALGFGPALFRKTYGETTYTVRGLPLGGFVKMAGMEPTEELRDDDDTGIEDDERAFHRRPISHRIAIIAAGPIMNFLLAAVILAIILSPLVIVVANVLPDSPAQIAGFQEHDRIVSVAGRRVITGEEVILGIQQSEGETIPIVVERDGQRETITVQPEIETGDYVIGIEMSLSTSGQRRPLGESLIGGFQQMISMTGELIRTLGLIVTGQMEVELSGPIGIFQMTGQSAAQGPMSLLSLMAVLSITVAVFNLLPIPILDGGALLFVIVEGIRGRPLAPEHKGIAQLVGLSLLLILMIFATIQDIGRLWNNTAETPEELSYVQPIEKHVEPWKSNDFYIDTRYS